MRYKEWTVKKLIKELLDVPNQNARVDLMIPYELYNDCSNDFVSERFYVDTSHALNSGCEKDYVEIYSLRELERWEQIVD